MPHDRSGESVKDYAAAFLRGARVSGSVRSRGAEAPQAHANGGCGRARPCAVSGALSKRLRSLYLPESLVERPKRQMAGLARRLEHQAIGEAQ